MMKLSSYDPHLFRWRRFKKNIPSAEKIHVKNGGISEWRRQVEKASEAAIYKVFPHTKPSSQSKNMPIPLQSSKQLEDLEDAYSEAEAVISDWMGAKLRLDLEEEEEEEEEEEMAVGGEQMRSAERRGPAARPTALNYNNFYDLYNHLAKEDEHGATNSFLQDLLEQEVLDCGMVEELTLDAGHTRRKFRDPLVMMEARRQQVRENRARQEEEKQRLRRERLARFIAAEEEKRRRQEEELRRKQEAHRQEELLQKEMVRLRRQMERRAAKQLLRQRETEEAQRAARSPPPAPPPPTNQQQQQQQQQNSEEPQEEKIQLMAHMNRFKFLQSHFSGWYSLVLDRRLRVGKAVALWEWRSQLRAWRAWRAVVWARRQQREVEALRDANRQSQLAVESDRRRLLRRCLREWQLWCRVEKERLVLLSQQEETQRKMAALIQAASAGELKAKERPGRRQEARAAAPRGSKTPRMPEKDKSSSSAPAAPSPACRDRAGGAGRPIQPWQVNRSHTAPTAAELSKARQSCCNGGGGDGSAGRFENRHAAQQQIISQQRKLLREQEEQLVLLKEKQKMMDLQMRTAPVVQLALPPAGGSKSRGAADPTRKQSIGGEADSGAAPPSEAVTRQMCRHPFVAAMEARAQQRAERKKEFEEHKRKREDEKLAELKAAEAQRQREEDEQKRKAAEKRKEEKRLEKLREEEKRRQQKRQQELLRVAHQHYTQSLLLHHGLAPWKRFIQLKRDNTQLAKSHHNLSLLRRCSLAWRQTARESLSGREAAADRLHRRLLLRRSLSCWERLMEQRRVHEERAEQFHRARALGRCLLALLDHTTQQKHEEWRRLKAAEEYRSRRVLQRCLLAWTQLPDLQRVEREKEARRVRLGRKVSAVLPDFGTYAL